MTKQEMQIAVAESVGWRFVHHPTTPNLGGYWEIGQSGIESYQRGDWGSKELAVGLPNYPQDLNALHEVVSTARFSNQFFFLEYQRALTEVVQGRPYHQECDYYGSISSFECIEATAHQRCEAYLRVKGLWRDTGHA